MACAAAACCVAMDWKKFVDRAVDVAFWEGDHRSGGWGEVVHGVDLADAIVVVPCSSDVEIAVAITVGVNVVIGAASASGSDKQIQ